MELGMHRLLTTSHPHKRYPPPLPMPLPIILVKQCLFFSPKLRRYIEFQTEYCATNYMAMKIHPYSIFNKVKQTHQKLFEIHSYLEKWLKVELPVLRKMTKWKSWHSLLISRLSHKAPHRLHSSLLVPLTSWNFLLPISTQESSGKASKIRGVLGVAQISENPPYGRQSNHVWLEVPTWWPGEYGIFIHSPSIGRSRVRGWQQCILSGWQKKSLRKSRVGDTGSPGRLLIRWCVRSPDSHSKSGTQENR